MSFALGFARGDDRTLTVTAVDIDGDPYVWAGSKLWFTAKLDVDDNDDAAVIYKTSDPGEGITFPEAGIATVEIGRDDTKALANNGTVNLFCDVQLLTAGGKIHTLEIGKIVVGAEVTFAVT